MNASSVKRTLISSLQAALLLLCLPILCLAKPAGLEKYSLVRVIDGDTIVVTKPGAQPEIHVRLLGIDCLESRRIERLEGQATKLGISVEDALALGKATTALVEQWLAGKPIYLELGQGANDKYGRLIAYVWTDEEQPLNLRLVASGQAMVYDGGKSFKGLEQFSVAEAEARSQQIGIWAARAPEATLSTSSPRRRTQPHSRRPALPIQLIILGIGVVIVVIGVRMR